MSLTLTAKEKGQHEEVGVLVPALDPEHLCAGGVKVTMSPTSRPEKSTIFLRQVNTLFCAKSAHIFVTRFRQKKWARFPTEQKIMCYWLIISVLLDIKLNLCSFSNEPLPA
jgi:hypothetical protein